MYDWPQQSMLMLLSFLGGLSNKDLGWPVGGSAALARAIERRFLSLGGEIQYQAKVKSIIIENDRAVGVMLSDGTEQRADIVISNAYGTATIFEMLAGRYTSRSIRRCYAAPIDRVEMGLQVCLGVARTFDGEPMPWSFRSIHPRRSTENCDTGCMSKYSASTATWRHRANA